MRAATRALQLAARLGLPAGTTAVASQMAGSRSGKTSLLAMVTVAELTASGGADPVTVNVLSAAAAVFSVAVRSNVALPVRSPAGMVRLKELTAVKSVPAAAVPSVRETVMFTFTLRATASAGTEAVTVMVVTDPSSTRDGLTDKSKTPVAVRSLSVTTSSVPATARESAAAVMRMVSSSSFAELLLGVKVNAPVADSAPAGMVMAKSSTAA